MFQVPPERAEPEIWATGPLRLSVPLWTLTVPVLLKAVEKVVVPEPAVLEKVPALLKTERVPP